MVNGVEKKSPKYLMTSEHKSKYYKVFGMSQTQSIATNSCRLVATLFKH